MEDQDQDIILLWEEEPLDDFGEPPEELFEEPPGEPPGEPPDEPLGEPPGEPPREPPSEPPREPPEKPPEELSYADQPVFEHVLPTTPIVSELIPISVLDTWRDNSVESKTHRHVQDSMYVPTLRPVLETHNRYCIWAAVHCRPLKRSNNFVARFRCQNPECSVRACLNISGAGHISLKFYEVGHCSKAVPTIIIRHVRDKNRSSYLRKFERELIFKNAGGLTPQQQYIQVNSALTPAQVSAGKGVTSRKTFKAIGREGRRDQARDPNVVASLNLMGQEKDSFIKHFLLFPTVQIVTFDTANFRYLSALSRNSTFGFDGTVVPTATSVGFKRLEMYNFVVQNPILNQPPIPLASAHLSCQSKEEISTFLQIFRDAMPTPFYPLAVSVDKAWALIRSITLVFNKVDLGPFIGEIFSILVLGTAVRKSFTLILVCNFHYMQAIKRFLRGHHLSSQKLAFYKMLSVALQSCMTWNSLMSLSRSMFVLCDTEKLTPEVCKEKSNIMDAIKNVRQKNAILGLGDSDGPSESEADLSEPVDHSLPNDGSERPLADSPFKKALQALRHQNLSEPDLRSDLPDNELFFPEFASFQLDNWLNCPLHLEALHKIVSDEKGKSQIEGFRPPHHKDSTNNVSEKHNLLFKIFVGQQPLRLDKLIEKNHTYFQSTQVDFLKSGVPLLEKAKSKKRKPLADIDKPEVFRKKKPRPELEDQLIADSGSIAQSVDIKSQSSQLLYNNTSNACAILAPINLFCNSDAMNLRLLSYLEKGSVESAFLSQVYECYLANMFNVQVTTGKSLCLTPDTVSHLKSSFVAEFAPEDIAARMHEPEKVIAALYDCPITILQCTTCNGCHSKTYVEDKWTWFTVMSHASENITRLIQLAHAPSSIPNYNCDSCKVVGVSAMSVRTFQSVPTSFLIKIGRNSVTVGSGQHCLTKLDNVPIDISKRITLSVQGKKLEYELLSGACFQGHDNAGHYPTFSSAENGVVMYSDNTQKPVPFSSKSFQDIRSEVIYLLYEKKCVKDTNLYARLRMNIPLFDSMEQTKNSDRGPTYFRSHSFPAQACMQSIQKKDFPNFFKQLSVWDRLTETESLAIGFETQFSCSHCRTCYEAGASLSLTALSHYSFPDCLATAKTILKQVIEGKGCVHVQESNVTLVISYLPESVVLFDTVESVNKVNDSLNSFLKEYCKWNHLMASSVFFVEGVYLVEEKKFCAYKNGVFTHFLDRKKISVLGKQIFFLKHAATEKFPLPQEVQDCLDVPIANLNFMEPVTESRDICIEDSVHQHAITKAQLISVLNLEIPVSELLMEAFFIALLRRFDLNDDISFLGPDHHRQLVEFGIPLHISDTEGWVRMIALGILNQNISVPGSDGPSRHFVLYAMDFDKTLIHIFDPLGKASDSITQKIYQQAMVLGSRFGKCFDFKINSLSSAALPSTFLSCDNRVKICAMGVKLISNLGLESFPSVKVFCEFFHNTLIHGGLR